MKIKFFLTSIIILLFSACASQEMTPPITAMGFIDVNKMPQGPQTISPIRLKALQETATLLGAQGALAWRAWHINQALQAQTSYLDRVFDFNSLLINNNVMPPVLAETDNTLNLADPNTIRLADKSYKILKPARFVTAPSTWRTYLWLDYQKPEFPDSSLLPRDQVESAAWNGFLKEGWEKGLQQANNIFMANLNRLKRDYVGMVLYRKLLAQNIVSAPYIAKADLGITGDSEQLRINDQVLRITAPAALQPDAQQWQAVVTK